MSDYISREWLSNAIHNFFNGLNHNVTEEDIQAYINATPSADVRENIHAEWIPKERTTECSIDIDIVCAKCGFVGVEGYAHGYELNEINIQEVRDYTKKLDMNFCTCCGAKMKGGE